MSVKLRVLVEMDVEYAKELDAFFKEEGVGEAEYLEMTLNDFIQFCANRLVTWDKAVMEVAKKREHGRNNNL